MQLAAGSGSLRLCQVHRSAAVQNAALPAVSPCSPSWHQHNALPLRGFERCQALRWSRFALGRTLPRQQQVGQCAPTWRRERMRREH